MKEYRELAEWLEAISRDIREVKEAIAEIRAAPPPAPNEPENLTLDELAVRLRVSKRTIERRRRAGTFSIPIYDHEGVLVARSDEVRVWQRGRLIGRWGARHDL